MFELLEIRQLLAGGSVVPLTINGTNADDYISITQSGNTLTVIHNRSINTYNVSWTEYGASIYDPGINYSISKIIVNGYGGNDQIIANDTVLKPMEVRGGFGDDSIRGGSRNDTLYAGNGPYNEWCGTDTLVGNLGDDWIMTAYGSGAWMYGADGDDTLLGGNYNDTCYGGNGDDSISSGGGNDVLYGHVGNDTLDSGDGADDLYAGDGHDSLSAGAGNDVLDGGNGFDSMFAGNGNDSLYGGEQDDSLDGGLGADRFSGGGGFDRADYSFRIADLNVSINGVADDGQSGELDNVLTDVEAIYGGSGDDILTGSAFNNTLDGGDGNDTLRGGGANDWLFGRYGDDVLFGHSGNDELWGEFGNDRLYGGDGNDLSQGGHGNDTLMGVGGGNHDTLNGNVGDDHIWLDADLSESHDGSVQDVAGRLVHRIAGFSNIAGKGAGEVFDDPSVDDDETEEYNAAQSNLDDNPLFSSLGPSRNDVNQGGVGDCWFLAALGSTASANPQYIRRSIVDMGDGTYIVQFYEGSSKRYYRVDNDLPVLTGTFNLAYAGAGVEGCLWVAMMEKAYAFHEGGGCYSGIDGGYADTAFDDLGIANQEIDVDEDNVMQTIKDLLAAGCAVTISSNWSIDGWDLGEPYVWSHVYTVVSIGNDGSITLRNPWGTDAGSGEGAWVQNANDGYVTFTQASIIQASACFTVGYF